MFTDIEGSTRLLDRLGPDFPVMVEDHLQVSRKVLAAHHGREIRTMGDGVFAVFADVVDAVEAAIDLQRAVAEHSWPRDAEVRVRIGLHTGRGVRGGDDYVGIDVHRAARIAAVAHGGQILISQSTRSIVEGDLGSGGRLADLGEHRLKDIPSPERLHQVSAPGLSSEFPPLQASILKESDVPSQLTSFVGRSTELQALSRLLESSRLVTITGPGGIGKTRLAVETAGSAGSLFPEGAYFVDLSRIRESDAVPSAIVESLQLRTGRTAATSVSDDLEALGRHFAGRAALLVLDNFEQVAEAAPFVRELMSAAPMIRVLTTSRRPLRIRGEQEFPLGPLRLPASKTLDPASALEVEAVSLFADRARSVLPEFELATDNLGPVLEIVRHLDGLPLAVELAASRLRLLTPEALAKRVQRDLEVLGAGSVDLPARQRTIDAAIEWSYQLLEESQRRMFQRLSVFSGGASLDAVLLVCGDDLAFPLDDLDALVVNTLVLREGKGEPRFRMLEPIRQFAERILLESDDHPGIIRRHGDYFLDLAERDRDAFTVSAQMSRMEILDAEHGNLRVALEAAIEMGRADTALAITGALWRYWQVRGLLTEARRWVDRALSVQGARPGARSRGLEALGGIAYWRGEMADSRDAYEEALELARGDGSPTVIANALYNVGFALANGDTSDRSRSRELLEESLALSERVEDSFGIGKAHYALGALNHWIDDHESAHPHLEQALAIFRDLDAYFLIAATLGMTGAVLQGLGRHQEALETLREGVKLRARERNPAAMTLSLRAMSVSEAALGRPERALRLQGAAAALREGTGMDFVPNIADDPALFAQVTDDRANEAIAEGRKMSLDEVVAFALADDVR